MRLLGYETDGYMVAASSPATENINNIIKCSENGVKAVILKSASSHREKDGQMRKAKYDVERRVLFVESGFDREILYIDDACSLAKEALDFTNMLIIPSVVELTMDPKEWVSSCKRFEEIGVHGIQLDFFYFKKCLSDEAFVFKMKKLLKTILEEVNLPIMPKLSIAFPLEMIVPIFKEAGIKYVSLLDSINTPAPTNSDFSGYNLSVFGEHMFWITREYTKRMVDNGFEVCAGGGVVSGEKAYDLITLGASTIQLATEVLINGFSRFRDIETEILQIENLDLKNDNERNSQKQQYKACFVKENCIECGKCRKQSFCESAQRISSGKIQCEGCGFCASICEYGAIKMEKI